MPPSSHSGDAPIFPSAGRELLLELKRANTNGGGYLPPYNTKLTRACFQDLKDSVQSVQEIIQAQSGGGGDDDENTNNNKPSMSVRPSILFHHASIQRHKRCLLAYHKHRMDQLKHIDLQHQNTSTALTNAAEAEFAQDYQDLRASYAEALDIELDLLPPTSHMLQVRVLQDVGQVVLDSGRSATFTKGSSLNLPRADALEFLQSGVLELMDGEEVDF
jgi:GINS complex subunit 1